MELRLISTLTFEDEGRIAEAICAAAAPMLEQLGIAYTLRIETADGRVFQQHSAPGAIVSHPSDPSSFLAT